MPKAVAGKPSARTVARVVGLEAIRVRIPLRLRIGHASHTRTETENVVVSCHLADGRVGFGEGVPRDYVTGETIDKSLDLLRQTDWEDQLPEVDSVDQALEVARSLTLPESPNDPRGCMGNTARCAVELAVLDAFGQRFGFGLRQIPELIADFRELYQPVDSCRYSGVVTSGSRLGELWAVAKLRLNRFRHIKVKVGTDGQDDERRLARFRWLFGAGRDLRIDANEAWTPEMTIDCLRRFARFNLAAVEQPVAVAATPELASVRRVVTAPIILDESLCSRSDAENAVAGGWCDGFNLRLSKCGGFIPSLHLALIAKRAGLFCQLGCQVGETGILSAAGRHFACGVGGLRYLEGSYDRFLVKERLTKEDLTFGFRGIAATLHGHGLGVSVDPKRLAHAAVSREWLFGGPDG